MPDRTPAYFPEACPHCGAKVWHKLSRVECVSWTEADFLDRYRIEGGCVIALPEEARRIQDLERALGDMLGFRRN